MVAYFESCSYWMVPLENALKAHEISIKYSALGLHPVRYYLEFYKVRAHESLDDSERQKVLARGPLASTTQNLVKNAQQTMIVNILEVAPWPMGITLKLRSKPKGPLSYANTTWGKTLRKL